MNLTMMLIPMDAETSIEARLVVLMRWYSGLPLMPLLWLLTLGGVGVFVCLELVWDFSIVAEVSRQKGLE